MTATPQAIAMTDALEETFDTYFEMSGDEVMPFALETLDVLAAAGWRLMPEGSVEYVQPDPPGPAPDA